MNIFTEEQACTPIAIKQANFNTSSILPYGLRVEHIYSSMIDFPDFLGFVNQQLRRKGVPRLESFLMPANFSSIVGEFLSMTIPKYCHTLVKNRYHNGHPDLIPNGMFPDNAVQYAVEGIEVKSSRHRGGWQGHNPESVWLLVFHFASNTANDTWTNVGPKPFQFKAVYAAKLDREDWNFSGRLPTSRRTITASVNQSGMSKLRENWVYAELN